MNKKALDEKYSYQIDEHNVVHLFRGEEDCQQHLTNPLISAIFKIETLEKENAELKERFKHRNCLDCSNHGINIKLLKVKNILKRLLEEEKENMYWEMNGANKSSYYEVRKEAEQFVSEVEE